MLWRLLAGASNIAALGGTAGPVVGDVLSINVINGAVSTLNPSGSPDLTAFGAEVTFKGMSRRKMYPVSAGGDPIPDFSSLTFNVRDLGYDATGTQVWRTRTVKGTVAIKEVWPVDWTALTTVAPNSFISGTNNYSWYTIGGGITGATRPTKMTSGTTPTVGESITDGTVTWVCLDFSSYTGFQEYVSGSDVRVRVALDSPIYATTEILSASIGSGCYQPNGTSNNAMFSIPLDRITNSSGLQVEPVMMALLTPPHQVIQGSATSTIELEFVPAQGIATFIGYGQQIAMMRSRLIDASYNALSGWSTCTASVLSNRITTSSPAGRGVECYRTSNDASGLAAGDGFIEFEFYPWIGPVWRSRVNGYGAPWTASTAYMLHQVVVNGGNVYLCTTAGTSASSGGPTGTTTTTDGAVVWTYVAAATTPLLTTRDTPARWHFYNDPASLFKRGHAHVNATGTNAGTPAVYATYAASKTAFDAGNSYGSIGLAAAALVTYHNTAGGGLTTHNNLAGGTMWLTGAHGGIGTSAAALASGSLYCYIKPDPTTPTASITTGATKTGPKMAYLDGVNLTATSSGNGNIILDPATDGATTFGLITSSYVVANGTITGVTGGTAPEVINRVGAVWYVNNVISTVFTTGNQNARAQPALMAGNRCAGTLEIHASNIIGNKMTGANMVRNGRGTSSGIILPKSIIVANNEIRGVTGTTGGKLLILNAVGTTADTGIPSVGAAMLNNLIESAVGGGSDKCYEIAADGGNIGLTYFVEAGNTYVGDRCNGPYNDDPNTPLSRSWYRANNIYTTVNVIWDSNSHATPVRSGNRCQVYSGAYWVGTARNMSLLGSQGSGLLGPQGYAGLRFGVNSLYNVFNSSNVSAQFVNDKTNMGTGGGTGNGDYHLANGSTMIGMAITQPLRFDLDGVARRQDGTGAIGCYEK